jgi:hypothetical protein
MTQENALDIPLIVELYILPIALPDRSIVTEMEECSYCCLQHVQTS